MLANEGEYKRTQGLGRLPGGYPCSYFLAVNFGEIVKAEVQHSPVPIAPRPRRRGRGAPAGIMFLMYTTVICT